MDADEKKPRDITHRTLGLSDIETDLCMYHSTGKKGPCIEKLEDALNTIQPTSVEAERVFR